MRGEIEVQERGKEAVKIMKQSTPFLSTTDAVVFSRTIQVSASFTKRNQFCFLCGEIFLAT